jgi:hypothetical protein
MRRIKSVGVLSCAKLTGALYGAIGLLLIPIALISGVASMAMGHDALGGVALVVLGIFAPILYGAMGFLLGAFSAWLYNLMAKWLGGIQIELEESAGGSSVSTNATGLI